MRYKISVTSGSTDAMLEHVEAIADILQKQPSDYSDRTTIGDVRHAMLKLEEAIQALARLRQEPLVRWKREEDEGYAPAYPVP
jgi:hypothetical protein